MDSGWLVLGALSVIGGAVALSKRGSRIGGRTMPDVTHLHLEPIEDHYVRCTTTFADGTTQSYKAPGVLTAHGWAQAMLQVWPDAELDDETEVELP